MFTFLLCSVLLFTDWIYYPPVREFYSAELGEKLSDIESHMPAGHIYRDSDTSTWSHETSHAICSNLRNQYKVDNGYYMLGNCAFLIKSPKVTLKQVASMCTEHKGGSFNLYLIQQQKWWNDHPLYVIEEHISYFNGSWVGIELKKNRGDSLEFATEFCFYMRALQKTIEKYDPNYEYKEQLWKFIDWQTRRTFALIDLAENTSMKSNNAISLREKFKDPSVRMWMSVTQNKGCKHCRNNNG